jgi:hypothetical protein
MEARLLALGVLVVSAVTAVISLQATFADSASELTRLAAEGQQVNPEWMININPGLIVFTMVFFAYITSFVRPLTSIIIGMAVATAGSVVSGTAITGLLCVGGIAVFSIGEMLSSPKKMEYLATLSPRGREGLFMGYANVPVAIGWIAGSIFAGSRYEEHGDKVNLARKHLVEVLGQDAATIESLPKTEVMPALARSLGSSVDQARELLFQTYHPERIWYDIALIGLASIVGMVVYDVVLRRVDAGRSAKAA